MIIVSAALAVAVLAAVRGMWSPCGLSMLSSLNPVSESARGHRFSLTVCWYVLGAALGGTTLGAGCALAAGGWGRLDAGPVWTWSLALAGAAVAVLSDSAVIRHALPTHPRQVDERWLTAYRRWIYAAGFGVQIGAGFATYIMTAAVYLTALLAVLSGSAGTAFLVGLTFGVVRGLGILVTAGVRSPAALRSLIGRIDRLGDISLRTAAAASAAVGAMAGWQLGGPAVALLVGLPLAVLAVARLPHRAAAATV